MRDEKRRHGASRPGSRAKEAWTGAAPAKEAPWAWLRGACAEASPQGGRCEGTRRAKPRPRQCFPRQADAQARKIASHAKTQRAQRFGPYERGKAIRHLFFTHSCFVFPLRSWRLSAKKSLSSLAFCFQGSSLCLGASRLCGSNLFSPHRVDHLDECDGALPRRVGQDAVAQVEDVAGGRRLGEDAGHLGLQDGARSVERHGV